MRKIVRLPASPLMWSAEELSELLDPPVQAPVVRYHLRVLRVRNVFDSFPATFPLDRRQAQRLLDYMERRPKGRGRKRKAQSVSR